MFSPPQELICERLYAKEQRKHETDHIIVENIKAAIKGLMSSGSLSAQSRMELGVILAACASATVAKARSHAGTERRICERLKVPRGCRSGKKSARRGEPLAFRQGAIRREDFEETHARIRDGAQIELGETVFVGACRSLGKLIAVGEDGECSIEFRCGEVAQVQHYKTMGLSKETRCVAGSARLQRVLPRLAPPERKHISTALSHTGLKERVQEHARSRCSESPHTRDEMSRRVDVFLHEKKQALIKTEPIEEMHEDFAKEAAPGQGCALSTYKKLLPWNMKDAYRETCLCAHCESQRLHMEGLRIAANLLDPVVSQAERDQDAAEEAAALRRQERARATAEQAARVAAEARESLELRCEPVGGSGGAAADAAALDADEQEESSEQLEGGGAAAGGVDGGGGDEDNGDAGAREDGASEDEDDDAMADEGIDEIAGAEDLPALKRLLEFMALKSKSGAVDALICGGDLPSAKVECIKGSCNKCGFKQLWSGGYRCHVVDEDGNLRPSASRVWGQRVRWERMRAGVKDREEVCRSTCRHSAWRPHLLRC